MFCTGIQRIFLKNSYYLLFCGNKKHFVSPYRSWDLLIKIPIHSIGQIKTSNSLFSAKQSISYVILRGTWAYWLGVYTPPIPPRIAARALFAREEWKESYDLAW